MMMCWISVMFLPCFGRHGDEVTDGAQHGRAGHLLAYLGGIVVEESDDDIPVFGSGGHLLNDHRSGRAGPHDQSLDLVRCQLHRFNPTVQHYRMTAVFVKATRPSGDSILTT